VNAKQPPGPPMTLGNMRALSVRRLIAFCHNNAYSPPSNHVIAF
jgi:hypothetical protein